MLWPGCASVITGKNKEPSSLSQTGRVHFVLSSEFYYMYLLCVRIHAHMWMSWHVCDNQRTGLWG